MTHYSDKAAGWDYLSVTPPGGVASSAVKACYQFDGTANKLTDRSANSNTLTSGGNYLHDIRVPGMGELIGMSLANTFVECTSPGAELDITGALTLEFTGLMQNDSTQYFISYGNNAGTEADNNLYQWLNTGAEYYASKFECENGSGSSSSNTTLSPIPVGVPCYWVLTRDASGNLNVYINGYNTDTGISVTPPTGGTSSTLRIGTNEAETAADKFRGILASVRISNVEFSAAQVGVAWKQVRGL
jgi:hypothetical protein